MRSVLENPEPIKNLHALLRAQQAFHAEASEALASVLAEVEEQGTAAEAEWRCVAFWLAARFLDGLTLSMLTSECPPLTRRAGSRATSERQ